MTENLTLQQWLSATAAKVRAYREAAGLTAAELDERAGFPSGYVDKIESAAISPSWVSRQRIAMALGLPAGALEGTP